MTAGTGLPVSRAAVWVVCKSTDIGLPMPVETEPSGIPSGPASGEEDEWTMSMMRPAPEGGVRMKSGFTYKQKDLSAVTGVVKCRKCVLELNVITF